MNIPILRRPLQRVAAIALMFSLVVPFLGSGVGAQPAGKTIVYPGRVAVTPGVCLNGEAQPGSVSIPSDTADDGIEYFITGPDADANYEVVARTGDAYQFGDVTGTGWQVQNQWNLVYSGAVPMPDCSGSTLVPPPVVDSPTNPAPQNNALGAILACGTPPYGAPTGSDVTSVIDFSNYVITQNGVQRYSGESFVLTSADEVLTLSFDWLAEDLVSEGQFFRFVGPVDADGNKVFSSASQWFPVLNAAGDREAGCATVVDGDITVVFTDYVNGRSSANGGVDGRIDVYVFLEAGSSANDRVIDFDFDDDTNFKITIPGEPTDLFGKRGWFNRDDLGVINPINALTWTIHVPANASGYTDLLLADNAPADGSWTFSCAGSSPVNMQYVAVGPRGPVTLDIDEDCSADQMTLSVASVPKNTTIDFYFDADVSPQTDGPFYNIATAQSNETEEVSLPYEVVRKRGSGYLDGSFAVIPIPPIVNDAVCIDEINDTWVPARVTLPTGQAGVNYSMTPDPFPVTGGHLVVIATLESGFYWAPEAAGNGWVLDTDTNSMVFERDVTNDPCVPNPPSTSTPTVPPCVPPPPEECVPTPTPTPGTPGPDEPEGGPTPTPCVPGPTPTIPPECLVTPTPPTVVELPKTGDGASGADSIVNTVAVAAALTMITIGAAAVAIRSERSSDS